VFTFPSDEWVVEFKNVINTSEKYKEVAAQWEGDVSFVCLANQSIGLNEGFAIWTDLFHGECRDAKHLTAEDAQKAKYVITGDYSRWKQVIKKELDPIKGMMQGKLKLKGDLPTIVKFIKAAQELVECSSKVPSSFLDEGKI
jgi:putative sterol carrier protein